MKKKSKAKKNLSQKTGSHKKNRAKKGNSQMTGNSKSVNSSFKDIYREDELPKRISNKYTICSCLHYTDTKQVYILKDYNNNKSLLKCRSGQDALLSKNEYNTLKLLEGEYVPKVSSFFEEDEKTYLIREYIEGETLEQVIEKHGVYEPEAAIAVMLEVCHGIEFMHNQDTPIVHRDIKPQNIIVTKDNKYKFIDMDTAREFKDENTYDTIFMGARATAAPEQFGFKQTSVRSDIYSLGVLFLYLLTGDYRVKEEEWKKLPKSVRRTVDKCLAFDPDNRYGSVALLIKELECLRRFKRQRKTMFFYMAAVLCLIITSTFFIRRGIKRYRFEHETVKFTNPRIERAVRESLNIDDDVILKPVDLENITMIILCGDRVFTSWEEHMEYHDLYYSDFNNEELEKDTFDYSDLKYFPNLKTLVLDNQGISDLSMIKGLDLERLCVEKNRISDLSGLEKQKNLTYLNVCDNPIESIDELSSLKSLESLNVMNTGVTDISSLNAAGLRELKCAFCNVTDYSVLPSLTHLSTLQISHADKETIAYINTLTDMDLLSLYSSEIESFTELSNLKNVSCIDIGSSPGIRDLEGVDEFPRLTFLGIADTNISDISQLPNAPGIEQLDITYTKLDSLAPLCDCKRLEVLFMDSGKEAELGRYDISDRVEVSINY